jgi:hypothetical protein
MLAPLWPFTCGCKACPTSVPKGQTLTVETLFWKKFRLGNSKLSLLGADGGADVLEIVVMSRAVSPPPSRGK